MRFGWILVAATMASAGTARSEGEQPAAARSRPGPVLRACADGLRIRETSAPEGAVVGGLRVGDEFDFLGEVSATTSKTSLHLGSGPKSQPHLFVEPWLRIRTKRGTTGWVFAGGVCPPAYHEQWLGTLELIGWSKDGKLAYVLDATDSYACDGSPGTFQVVDLKSNKIVRTIHVGCPQWGSVWTDRYGDIAKVLAEHSIERVWRIDWVSTPIRLSRDTLDVRLAVHKNKDGAPRSFTVSMRSSAGVTSVHRKLSTDQLPMKYSVAGALKSPYADLFAVMIAGRPEAGEPDIQFVGAEVAGAAGREGSE